MDNPLIAIAAVGALGGICQWLAWRFKLPSILFLLTAGIVVGPLLGLFDPDEFLGDLLFPIVSVFVAIILFEGGLTLKFKDIQGHGTVVTRLISLGVLITWLLLASAAHFLFDMPWPLAFVFGSIAVVSGPTVVKPLLRAVRPSDKVGHILHWEGILIDPIGVFLALLVFDFVMLDISGDGFGHIVWILFKLVAIGSIIGVAGGALTALALRRYLVPDFLVNVLTLITVVCAFVLAETLQHESGLLAVTIMGVWLANTRGLHVDEILHFKEDLSVILISTLFILLASRVDISIIPQYWWQILCLLAIAQFLIRPINAFLCTLGSDLSTGERVFVGWLAPRGIVAAAVSSVFFLRLQEVDMPMAELLVPLTFSVIIGTVVFQSLTAKLVADKLGISNPEPNGVLFFGANDIALRLAAALREHSVKVMLADTSWRNVRHARQQGFDAYHGNPTSGHASENLDLQGIGKLLAVSSNRDANALAGMHFRQEFGTNAVFTLEGASDDAAYERFDTANRNRANPLFDASLSHSSLARQLRHGKIRHITIPKTAEIIATPADNSTTGNAADTLPASSDGTDLEPDNPTGSIGTETNVAGTSDAEGSTKEGSSDGSNPQEHSENPSATQDEKDTSKRVIDAVDTAVENVVDAVAAGESEEHSDDVDTAEGDVVQPLYTEEDLKLFAVNKDGKLLVYGAGDKITLKPGWQLVVLSADPESAEG